MRCSLVLLALTAPAAAEPASGTYGELGYSVEWSHWATPSGHGGVLMSGVTYTESRGAFVNLMLSGVAASGEHLECTRRVGDTCTEAVDTGPSEQELAAADALLRRRPAGLRLTAWHESLGSDIDGVDARLGYTTGGEAVMTVGVAGGLVRSNRRSAPIMPPDPGVPDPPDPTFERGWVGGFIDARVSTDRAWGPIIRLLVAYDGGLMVVFHAGYERRIGRLNLSVGLDTDSYRPKRAGAFAGVGVLF